MYQIIFSFWQICEIIILRNFRKVPNRNLLHKFDEFFLIDYHFLLRNWNLISNFYVASKFFFEKKCISLVLIFADGSFENFSWVLIFANRQKLSIFFNLEKIEKSICLFKHLKCYNITTQINQINQVRCVRHRHRH